MRSILCAIFGHRFVDIRRPKPWLWFVTCSRCQRRFVMNDRQRAFLRVDDDVEFVEGLLRVYPWLSKETVLGQR